MSVTYVTTEGHAKACGLGQAMRVSEGHAVTGVFLILVASTVTWGYSVIWARVPIKSHV